MYLSRDFSVPTSLTPHQHQLKTLPSASRRKYILSIRSEIINHDRDKSSERTSSGKRDHIPLVVPSYVIPPPKRGSQYNPSDFFTGLGNGSGGSDGDGGGGGNRGGAFNVFSAGGFFGPGSNRANLIGRLRLLFLFMVWSACMYTIVSSVFKLMRYAVSGIKIPRWDSAEETHVTVLSSETEDDTDSGVAGGVIRDPGSASIVDIIPQSGQKQAQSLPSVASIGGGGAEDLEGIEALAVDERQRAYLDLLQRHSTASNMAREAGTSQGELMANSLGIYVMILGCVAFFFVAS